MDGRTDEERTIDLAKNGRWTAEKNKQTNKRSTRRVVADGRPIDGRADEVTNDRTGE